MAAFDYTSRDFANIKGDLLARASRVVPEWTTRDPGDFGVLLTDMWAQMGDVLHYYVDRAAGESFLATVDGISAWWPFQRHWDGDGGQLFGLRRCGPQVHVVHRCGRHHRSRVLLD